MVIVVLGDIILVVVVLTWAIALILCALVVTTITSYTVLGRLPLCYFGSRRAGENILSIWGRQVCTSNILEDRHV